MAHFPQIPTVRWCSLNSVTQYKLVQVCGTSYTGNVQHTLYGTQFHVEQIHVEIIFLSSFVDHCTPTQMGILAK